METLSDITLIQALMVAIFAGIAGIDLFNVLTHIHRPIIAGPIVGILMGNPEAGLVAGASFELMWMGLVPLAGAQPPNVVAIPFALFVQVCITFLFTAFSPLMKKADHYADTLNYGGIAKLNYLGMTILFLFYSIVTFLVVYLGAAQAAKYVAFVPKWITEGLGMAGGLMPAIGFGILLNIMLRKEYVAYYILGFVLAAYLQQPLLAIALIGVVFALIEYFLRDNIAAQKPAQTQEEEGI